VLSVNCSSSMRREQAADEIVKHLDSGPEKVSLGAVEDIAEFAKEFISLEAPNQRT
jgi:hypothetical protein